ncbi:MAG: 2-hydroxyacid dehydrogenase [Lewinellaceae bacterium]|nr:2-hydroxyacid dehydrogenase [Lewinellaceae bacterium]
MKVVIFSASGFERNHLEAANAGRHELRWLPAGLDAQTALLAKDCDAACLFVNDDAKAEVLEILAQNGVRYLALRSAGFNHVDLEAAQRLKLRVANVPEYSPYAVAEHAVALMLALNRKLIRANRRVEDLNFLLDGLVGFDMNGKTAGIVGTGKIGAVLARILHGFGCRLLAYDLTENPDLARFDLTYTDLDTLFRNADIISLHVPLNPQTRYMINAENIAKMKRGVMLINTSRGGLVNTKEVVQALKSGQIGSLGLDVYEEEQALFFEDHSNDILQDDTIARLLTFPNVLITAHQAFLTDTALKNIADTTFANLTCFEYNQPCGHELFAR